MRITPNSIAGPSRLRPLVSGCINRQASAAQISSNRLTLRRPYRQPANCRSLTTSPHRHTSTPSTQPASSGFSTINASEISHFSRLATEWWSESGEFALLHRMNPARIEYIRQLVAFDHRLELPWTFSERHNDKQREMKRGTGRWLADKRVLDVGCGGGLLSEALTRLGGEVIGVDASEVNIGMAIAHASGDPGLPLINPNPTPNNTSSIQLRAGRQGQKGKVGSLEYRHTSAEALRDAGEKFDVVCSMEVVEHVDQPGEFLKALGDMVKPGGYLILSTISRTPLSRLLTLTLAEDVLRLVTPGTHTYSKFIKPEEIRRFVYTEMGGHDIWEKEEDAADIRRGEVGRTRGIVYDPLGGRWRLWGGVEGGWGKGWGEGCNYMYGAKKRVDAAR